MRAISDSMELTAMSESLAYLHGGKSQQRERGALMSVGSRVGARAAGMWSLDCASGRGHPKRPMRVSYPVVGLPALP